MHGIMYPTLNFPLGSGSKDSPDQAETHVVEFHGEEAVEFGDVFIWTFGVVAVIGVLGQIIAMFNNNKLRKASKIEAERIIAEEKENTQDK